MASDLVHLDREIQKLEGDIAAARRNAVVLIGVLGGPDEDGNPSGDITNVEGARQEAKARRLEEELNAKIAEKQTLEAEIADMEHQKTQLTINYEAELDRLTQEIARRRGSSGMF